MKITLRLSWLSDEHTIPSSLDQPSTTQLLHFSSEWNDQLRIQAVQEEPCSRPKKIQQRRDDCGPVPRKVRSCGGDDAEWGGERDGSRIYNLRNPCGSARFENVLEGGWGCGCLATASPPTTAGGHVPNSQWFTVKRSLSHKLYFHPTDATGPWRWFGCFPKYWKVPSSSGLAC